MIHDPKVDQNDFQVPEGASTSHGMQTRGTTLSTTGPRIHYMQGECSSCVFFSLASALYAIEDKHAAEVVNKKAFLTRLSLQRQTTYAV